MSSQKISQLPSVLNSTVGSGSVIPLTDSVDSATKSITLSQLDLRWGVAPSVSIATTSSHSGGFSANTTGTYTPPTNCKLVKVTMVGGGGGGGGAQTSSGTSAGGAGGSGGGAVIAWFTPSGSYTYTVGAGGATSAAGGIGNAGNATTFTNGGTVSLSAGGGNAGIFGVASSSASLSAVPSGGGTSSATVTGGSAITITGGMPGYGQTWGTTNALGGAGGNSFLGTGALATTSNANGNNATTGYGGGGSGGNQVNNNGTKTGGSAADGIILIEEWY